MVTRVYLIRHGATTLSAEDRFAGAVDVPLSDEGRAQASRLGSRLASTKLAAIYASPLSRTVETARLVGAPQGLEPQLEAGLREIAHGHWEGMRRQEVEQQFTAEYQAWEADPFTFAPPAGETGLAVMARALPVIREIVFRHPGQAVAIVSHKATIRLLLCSVLGIDARGYRDRLDQAPACLNIVDFKDSVHARLMLYNDTSHYAPEARRALAQLSKWWDPVSG